MNQLHLREALEKERALRQSMQPVVMLAAQLVACPDGGGSGQGVEVIQFEQPGGGFVVIAANKNLSQAARAFDHLVGRSPVADDVAQVGHEIICRSRRKAGVQRFQIGMNVAKEQDSQSAPDKVAIIERAGTEGIQGAVFILLSTFDAC